jgi:hypothetical protein
MTPETGTALLIIAVFVLPGFITLLFRERTYSVKGQDSPFERLLNALYYSAIVFAVLALAALIAGAHREDVSRLYGGHYSLSSYLFLALFGLLVMPLLITEAGGRWQRSERLRPFFLKLAGVNPGHGIPAAWEQLFIESKGVREGKGLLLRVTLADGRVIGGFFGESSLAGYTGHTRDLFLEQRWTLDDDKWFIEPAPGTRGVWIDESQIHSIEAYAPG